MMPLLMPPALLFAGHYADAAAMPYAAPCHADMICCHHAMLLLLLILLAAYGAYFRHIDIDVTAATPPRCHYFAARLMLLMICCHGAAMLSLILMIR